MQIKYILTFIYNKKNINDLDGSLGIQGEHGES